MKKCFCKKEVGSWKLEDGSWEVEVRGNVYFDNHGFQLNPTIKKFTVPLHPI
ncbi:hypothetical protein [Flavobacterium nackdongense]|uniref:hypothetical protein n=1 Tax=Flavobacterium nackdongense TaxID=2547394 RepID=UPI0013FD0279|nr:hypothetical protein [Flavobacterium nackdongense]